MKHHIIKYLYLLCHKIVCGNELINLTNNFDSWKWAWSKTNFSRHLSTFWNWVNNFGALQYLSNYHPLWYSFAVCFRKANVYSPKLHLSYKFCEINFVKLRETWVVDPPLLFVYSRFAADIVCLSIVNEFA